MKITRRILLALTGASGMPYALRLLEALRNVPDVEPHLIVSDAARKVLSLEIEGESVASFESMATRTYGQSDIGAGPASGSWKHAGMVVCPCSMASLGAIANGLGSNLIHRAADVALKECRPLILVTRETPLNQVHLKNMLAASQAGARIMPACPGFYQMPRTIQDVVDQLVARVLDHLDVEHTLGKTWQGEDNGT